MIELVNMQQIFVTIKVHSTQKQVLPRISFKTKKT